MPAWKDLGSPENKVLGISIGDFGNYGEMTQPKYGQHHSIGLCAGLIIKGGSKQEHQHSFLCFLSERQCDQSPQSCGTMTSWTCWKPNP